MNDLAPNNLILVGNEYVPLAFIIIPASFGFKLESNYSVRGHSTKTRQPGLPIHRHHDIHKCLIPRNGFDDHWLVETAHLQRDAVGIDRLETVSNILVFEVNLHALAGHSGIYERFVLA